MKYAIIEALEVAGLVKLVQLAIDKDGLEPLGGPFPLPERMHWYGQAMVKRENLVYDLAIEVREIGRIMRELPKMFDSFENTGVSEPQSTAKKGKR